MADLIGAIASAITIANVASGAASNLKKLWDEVQNVPETITDLVQQIEILESHIWQIESEINERGASIRPILDDATVRLSTEYCRGCMKGLASIVDDLRVKIDTQKDSKQTFAKVRVVLKKRILAHFERRLEKAVSLLSLTQQGYAIALLKLQPHIVMGLLTVHDSHRRNQLNVFDGNSNMPARGVFQTREISFDFRGSSRREGQMTSTSYNLSMNLNVTKRTWRSWSNSLMNGTVGIHCSSRQSGPHSMLETTYTVRIHLPEWLAMRVWDFQVTKAASGWKVNLRSWRVAPNSLAIKAVRNNDYYGLRDCLVSGFATVFDRTETGDTLLHLAAQHDNRDIVHLLLAAGLDFAERNDELISALRRFVYHFYRRSSQTRPAHLSDMLSHLSSQGALEDPMYDWVTSFDAINAPVITVLDYLVQSKGAFDTRDALMSYQAYVIPRIHISTPFFTVAPGDWSPQSIRVLQLKDGNIHKSDISRAVGDGFPIWTFLAYYIGTSESPSHDRNMKEWQNFIRDGLKATGRDSMHRLISVQGLQPWLLNTSETPLTALLWLLLLALDTWYLQGLSRHGFEKAHSSRLRPALQRWLTLLKDCGVDLQEYGDREQDILQRTHGMLSYDWKLPSGRDDGGSVRLRNIIHGANIEDWELVWKTESLRHDEETVVCESPFSVPGSWPDDEHAMGG